MSKRPRILFVCHRFPFPPKRGGKIRPFNILSHLQGRADVSVASLVRSREEEQEARGIQEYCAEFVAGRISSGGALYRMLCRLPTSIPSSMGNFHSPRLEREIRELLRRRAFDLVFVHCSSAAQYVEHVADVPKVMDFGDMDSEKWASYVDHRPFPLNAGYWLESRKLRRAERRLAASFDLSTCTTRAELHTLQAMDAARACDWFPNGVDSDFFRPSDRDYDTDRICFAGRMDYFPNQQAVFWLCGEILPRLKRLHPKVRLVIVGAEPPAAIRRLAEEPAVEVTGTVPDVRPHVTAAAVSVAPLRIARGTQNKILEAAAMGLPVVTTSRAAGGVDMRPGRDLLVADDSDGFAEQVASLLRDSRLRKQFADAARARVLSNHSWAASMTRLDGILDREFPGLLPPWRPGLSGAG